MRDWRWWGREAGILLVAVVLLPFTVALFVWLHLTERRDPFFDKHD